MKEGRRSVRCRWLITVLVLQASFHGGLVSASSNSASAAPDVTITAAAALATSTSTPSPSSSQPSSQPSLTAATATVASTFRTQTMEFFKKFDSYGPTLTLTLRDPSRTTLLGGGQGSSISGGTDRNKRKLLWSSSSSSKKNSIHDAPRKPKKKPRAAVPDDGTFGIYSKIAAHFHVSSSASTATNGAGDYSTTSGAAKSTQYSDGYMLDDGDIYLDPPSSASSASNSKGLFSIRDASNRILSGKGTTVSTLSECAQNVHPEIQYEIQSKQSSLPLFPKSAPWIAGLHCGMIWNPFPIYKPGYPEGYYGHKLLSQPHFVRCGVRLSLPRVSHVIQKMRSTSRGINRSFTQQITDDAPATSTTKELDLGVTYQESTYSPTAGTLEVILGKVRPSLPPAKVQDGTPSLNYGINSQSLRQSDDVYRRHNHLLLRLSTTTGNTNSMGKQNSIITPEQHPFLSSIEYIKASVRFPTPWFLRTRYNDRLSVSPSFDFVEGVGRCTFSGDVGRSGRTRAVLRLDSEEESTLTIVRALDESKIIAPTISLNTGKIVYDYYLNLDGKQQQQNNEYGKVNSSLRAHVDPTKGILLKWTDGIRNSSSNSGGSGSSGSCWVTECRIPLGISAPGSPLAADVRVGRRWVI